MLSNQVIGTKKTWVNIYNCAWAYILKIFFFSIINFSKCDCTIIICGWLVLKKFYNLKIEYFHLYTTVLAWLLKWMINQEEVTSTLTKFSNCKAQSEHKHAIENWNISLNIVMWCKLCSCAVVHFSFVTGSQQSCCSRCSHYSRTFHHCNSVSLLALVCYRIL